MCQAQTPEAGTAAQAEDSLDEELRLLQRHGVAVDTRGILEFLRRQQPSAERRREIEALIGQLASDTFAQREEAVQKLVQLGPAARAKLEQAARSDDLETMFRAKRVLQKLEAGQGTRDALMLAALQILKARGEAEATPVLLRTLASLDDAHAQGVAAEAIWATTEAKHAALLRESLKDAHPQVRAAAIVALELAVGDEAAETITPYLQSKLAELRLAAARALADREPRESIAVLVELTADPSEGVAWQADALLQMLAGKRMQTSEEVTLAEAWRAWSKEELPTATLQVPLGKQRLDLSAGRNTLQETFSGYTNSLAKGYGDFRYEADNGGAATVADGRLLIDGDNDEGDQRLFITSQRMIGRGQWPKNLEVRAKLGGKAGNNVGFHVGVSIGRVKVLFHPGFVNGGFRAETTDTHQPLFANERMGFTPATGVMHEMLIEVNKTPDGAEFRVTVHDANSENKFQRTFAAANEQLGDFNRIGLERSGRRGADAMFDSVSIQLGR